MYAVEVRDHIMIAHSFRGAVFGPAQALHGATFVIDACFIAETLDANGIVIDIGLARTLLHEVLQPLNYQNLDEIAELRGVNTTAELLARLLFDRLKDRLAASPGVTIGDAGLHALKVTLTESPQAWAAYEGYLS